MQKRRKKGEKKPSISKKPRGLKKNRRSQPHQKIEAGLEKKSKVPRKNRRLPGSY
jgi:hypothetical protein